MTLQMQRQAHTSVPIQQRWLCSGCWLRCWLRELSQHSCHWGWQVGCATGNGCNWWHLPVPTVGIPSGPGSSAQAAAGLGAAAPVEREEERLEASMGHACEHKAVMCTGPWDALWCDSATTLSPGSVQNIKQLRSLSFSYFLPLEAGGFDRYVCRKRAASVRTFQGFWGDCVWEGEPK